MCQCGYKFARVFHESVLRSRNQLFMRGNVLDFLNRLQCSELGSMFWINYLFAQAVDSLMLTFLLCRSFTEFKVNILQSCFAPVLLNTGENFAAPLRTCVTCATSNGCYVAKTIENQLNILKCFFFCIDFQFCFVSQYFHSK